MPVYSLREVTVRYPRAGDPVLSGLSLQIRPGEFIGIMGPTGCGKTTLLKVLAGVIPHYEACELEGEVRILGRPSSEWPLAHLSQKIGLVMEDPEGQIFNLRVRDEVTWGLENLGLSREEILDRATHALCYFGIESLADRVTFDLSGGEKQRLALASIYALNPEVLLLDKPTSELDPAGAAQVRDAVELLRQERRTVVLVEDRIDWLVSCCDRLLLMVDGRIQIDAPPDVFVRLLPDFESAGVRNSDLVLAAMKLDLDPMHFVKLLAGGQ